MHRAARATLHNIFSLHHFLDNILFFVRTRPQTEARYVQNSASVMTHLARRGIINICLGGMLWFHNWIGQTYTRTRYDRLMNIFSMRHVFVYNTYAFTEKLEYLRGTQ